jgi:hypothetical protein
MVVVICMFGIEADAIKPTGYSSAIVYLNLAQKTTPLKEKTRYKGEYKIAVRQFELFEYIKM